MKQLEYTGEFKRFGLSIYDEGKHLKPNSTDEVLNVMVQYGLFSNKTLIGAMLS